ncbi:MAG: magnesium-translocating P-type ATPase [Pseudomonadota bacterium]
MTVSVLKAYWSQPATAVVAALDSAAGGLTGAEAQRRLREFGPNRLRDAKGSGALSALVKQFASPLVLILLFAASVSLAIGEWLDASIILAIVAGSGLLGFAQEYSASRAVQKLRQQVSLKARVLRDGAPVEIPAEAVVPGDVVMLAAGSLIPADGLILAARDCFVIQAALTGETFPAEKLPGVVAPDASLPERTNCAFMGTSVRSGTAQLLVVETGARTQFGNIAHRLNLRPPETEFERGIRRFGYLLTQVMLVLVIVAFTINVLFHRPVLEALLFSIALAVGLSPELLPAVITVTLGRGARAMAAKGVIVRRLNAIENLGSMDVFCTDKTGTLTEGAVRLEQGVDPAGVDALRVRSLAYLNAAWETGIANPLDQAIVAGGAPVGFRPEDWRKLDEIPYDFQRKRLSVAGLGPADERLLICKGAFATVAEVCTRVCDGDQERPLDASLRAGLEQRFAAWSQQGFRVLGVASRRVPEQSAYTAAEEQSMTFEGFLLFADPPKAGVRETLGRLAALGVQVKVITGDNRLVAVHVAEQVGMHAPQVLTGQEINQLKDETFWHRAARTDLFVEVDPSQKERIILALRHAGHVVGYLGDGINDAPALYAADAGISVDTAVDVAKEAADFVLLGPDLEVLRQGIEYGRTTFANTLKYIYMTTSANFGNMVSMAFASLFLPFLPLLAKQILLNNFLADIPAIGIATDRVDRAAVDRPHRWNIAAVRRFMLTFGLISSLFDGLTFVTLLWLTDGSPLHFRTGWFVESLLTQLLVVLVVRTRLPCYRSRPGSLLLGLTAILVAVALGLPYLPGVAVFDFVPLPGRVMAAIVAIVGLYLLATEMAKRRFYRRSTP